MSFDALRQPGHWHFGCSTWNCAFSFRYSACCLARPLLTRLILTEIRFKKELAQGLAGALDVLAAFGCSRLLGVDAKNPLLAGALAIPACCNVNKVLHRLKLDGAAGAGRPALA